jgi:hypothetical protein
VTGNAPTKPAPLAHEFQRFLDELAKVEPWVSMQPGKDDWLIGYCDHLERLLMSIANYRDDYAMKMRPQIRAILANPTLIVEEKHQAIDQLIMTTPTR